MTLACLGESSHQWTGRGLRCVWGCCVSIGSHMYMGAFGPMRQAGLHWDGGDRHSGKNAAGCG